MALQTSGAISFTDLRDEFNSGGTGSIQLATFTRGAGYVPSSLVNTYYSAYVTEVQSPFSNYYSFRYFGSTVQQSYATSYTFFYDSPNYYTLSLGSYLGFRSGHAGTGKQTWSVVQLTYPNERITDVIGSTIALSHFYGARNS